MGRKEIRRKESVSGSLPHQWVSANIKNVCQLINGRAFKPRDWSSTGLPIIRIQNLNNNEAEFNYCNFEVDQKYLVERGQLLFAWSGTPGTSFGAHIWNKGKAVLNQHIFKVHNDEKATDKIFLMYLLNHKVSEYVAKAHGTAGLAHITKGKFENSEIPLPPLPEQRRIVAKIEELFTKLDSGVDSLKRVKAQIKRYRQAVLKAAFEGKLTEELREQGALARVEGLLEEIRIKRRDNAIKLKYNELPEQSSLPSIPDGWTWISNEGLLRYVTSGSRDWKKYYSKKGALFIRTQDIRTNRLELDEVAYVTLPERTEGKRSLAEDGDLLMTITGANVGKVAYISRKIGEAYVSQSVALMKYLDIEITKYLWYYFQCPQYGQGFINSLVYGVGRPVLSLENMKEVPVALCSKEEQHQIVSKIERRFSVADEAEKIVDRSLKEAERLRQSILKRAFAGKLVLQDPNDEPASVLLERIKAEKAKLEAERKSEKKRTRKVR